MSNIDILGVLNLDRDKILSILKEEEIIRFSQDYINKCNEVAKNPNGWLEVTSQMQKNLLYKFGYTDIISNTLAVNLIRTASQFFPNDEEIKNSVVHFRENKANEGSFIEGDIIKDFNLFTTDNLKIKLYDILDKNKYNIILAGSHT
jgi:hypothetical protein